MKPKNFNITFIVQGNVVPDVTENCLLSIRRNFPESVIILSTWEGQTVSDLTYDELILSEDPGFICYSDGEGGSPNNVNRQIVSTLAGLKHVQTRYAFKIRTDFCITGDNFLKFWNEFKNSDEAYRIFYSKILACTYFSRNPSSGAHFPFHPSDLAFFGETEDLFNLFNIPLAVEGDKNKGINRNRFNRYAPEQHIFINCLRKNNKTILCNYYDDNSDINVVETEKYFASNFVFLTFEQFNIEPSKSTFFMNLHPDSFRTCYTHYEWMNLYKKYVDMTIDVPAEDPERRKIEISYRKYKKFKIIINIILFFFFYKKKNERRKIRGKLFSFFLNGKF